MSNRRSGGGFANNRGNRYDNNNQGRVAVQNRGGNNFGQQQPGWRQQNVPNQGRQGGPQGGGGGGGGMNNSFDNRQFQQHHHHQQQQQQHHQQQQQMMNQNNQFANQLSNAVLRSSVGPNPGMMSSFGGNQDQPVVMVLPQSQAAGGMMGNMGGGNMGNMGMGNMGGNMGNQNPFAAAVMNQQKPMQVIVGNLPGLNPAAFGQQVLPAYGQGVGEQNMGMFGQQNQQGSFRYGRDNKNATDRGRNQRNQKTLVRRNEANDRGRLAGPRGVAKKRTIAGQQQQYGDLKKARTTGLVTRTRVGAAIVRKDRLKNRRANKVAGAKAAVKTEDKKEGDKEDVKPAANGEAEAADGEGEAAADGAADGEKKPSKYDEISVEFLNCKVCKKVMSDGPSFESHLTGKAHVNLMKILEDKFVKRAELLMSESKMCEDEIAVEKDRQRRQGKGARGMKANQNHCKMCDCTYTVNWGAHKASVWHRVLKEFLHPNCRFCKSQFVHRKDWVEHVHSIGHMKKLMELKAEGKISVTDQETPSQEELFAVHIEMTKEERPLNIVNIHFLGGRQPLTDDVRDMLQGENGEVILPEGEIVIPDKFEEGVAVGENAVFAVGGSCCKVCRIYIQEGVVDAHVKSRQHFDSYVEYLKRVIKLREQKAEQERKAKEEAEKKAKAEAEAAVKAAEAAAKAAEDAEKLKVEAEAKAATAAKSGSETVAPAATSPSKVQKVEKMEVEQAPAAAAATSPTKTAEAATANAQEVEQNAEDEQMEEDEAVAEDVAEENGTSPAKTDAVKPVASPNKTPQRGGQNNRGVRGSPARGGRGAPNRGGGGFNRGGRGGQQQQQQTPARGNATPGNMRGGRGGGQARGANRGGPRGSPARGRGRGAW